MSLLSSLRGELVAYYDVLSKHIYFHRLQEKVYKKASEAGVICGKMNYALSYDFIAYRESLNKIGYLGASISGDLAKVRSEEHTSELQSLMRISYAVFCLKKKNNQHKYRYV